MLPLIGHVFGIQPDAVNKTIVFDPHVPAGWKDMSIEDLPVGTNMISFARARTEQGIEYSIEAKQNGWNFVLKGGALPGARYCEWQTGFLYLNPQPSRIRRKVELM